MLKGIRAKKGAAPIALTAKMSDMPGVAPVPLDYDVTDALALTVGGAKTTLKGKGHVTAAAKSPVPVPPLKGSVKNKKNSFAVVVTKFTFTVLGMDMTCVPTDVGRPRHAQAEVAHRFLEGPRDLVAGAFVRPRWSSLSRPRSLRAACGWAPTGSDAGTGGRRLRSPPGFRLAGG